MRVAIVGAPGALRRAMREMSEFHASLARIEALLPGVDSRNLAHRVTSKAMADALYERVARHGDDPETLLADPSRWFVDQVPR